MTFLDRPSRYKCSLCPLAFSEREYVIRHIFKAHLRQLLVAGLLEISGERITDRHQLINNIMKKSGD